MSTLTKAAAARIETDSLDSRAIAAAKRGDVQALRDLLLHVARDDNTGSGYADVTRDALCMATGYGKIEATKALLDARADPNACSSRCQGRNALHEACMWSAGSAIISLLLDCRADPEVRTENQRRATARRLARDAGHNEIAAMLPEPQPPPIGAARAPCRRKNRKVALPLRLTNEVFQELSEFCQRLGVQPFINDFNDFNVRGGPDWSVECIVDRSQARNPGENRVEPQKNLWDWCPPGLLGTFWPAGGSVFGDLDDPNSWAARASASDMSQSRAALPITPWREDIVKAVWNHQVVILRGEAGSGKSTQVPQYLLDDWGRDAHIVVTEPRRLAAMALTARVAAERGEAVAERSVGYHVAGDERLPPCPFGSIVYCTEGSALRRIAARGAGGASHFVVDEAHERSVELDLLLCTLRDVIDANKLSTACKTRAVGVGDAPRLIVMSATVDIERLSKYFRNAHIIDVPGRSFPVEVRYLEDAIELLGPSFCPIRQYSALPPGVWSPASQNDVWEPSIGSTAQYSDRVVSVVRAVDDRYIPLDIVAALLRQKLAQRSITGNVPGAVLFFLPGRAEMSAALRWFLRHGQLAEGCVFIELRSGISHAAQAAAFAKDPRGRMKVVIATNVAETSLTIPDVVCVIDCGLIRIKDKGVLRTVWAGKNNVKQRCGRAGRVAPGEYYALFTASRFTSLCMEVPPEMTRSKLTTLVLVVLKMRVLPREFLKKTLDPPSEEQMDQALNELEELRAVRYIPRQGYVLTGLGRLLETLPTEPRLGLALVASLLLNVHVPMVRVVAVLGAQFSLRAGGVDAVAAVASEDDDHNENHGSDVFPAARALAEFESCDGQDERREFCGREGLVLHLVQQAEATARQIQAMVERLHGGEPVCLGDLVNSLELHWPTLSWLLALGLGDRVALHVGSGHLRLRDGRGRAGRESCFAGSGGHIDPAETLVFGSTIPTKGGSQGPQICRDLSPVPLLALLLFGLSFELRDGLGLVSGWIRVESPLEHLCFINAARTAHADLLEAVAERLSRPVVCGMVTQWTTHDEHAKRLQAWEACLERIMSLALVVDRCVRLRGGGPMYERKESDADA